MLDKKLSPSLFALFLTLGLLTFISCDQPIKTPDGCQFNRCGTTGWSFVDAITYENLLGPDKLIHPDSLVITNTRGDSMFYKVFTFSSGWTVVTAFSPFQEIYCFNQCLLDSAFTRTYYLYLGNQDTDTLEVHFPVRSAWYTTTYNGLSGEVPEDRPPSSGLGGSTFWFRKKILSD